MNREPSISDGSDPLVRVQDVSKKFCLSLKKSLWYGLKDMGNELLGRRHGGAGALRPKEFWAVHDVGFELKRGESLGLIGHNGAGKTTLLKMLNGLIKPDAGRIEMRGRVGALIALGAGFNPILTGRENIFVNASVLGLSKSEIYAKLDEIIDFAEIGDFIDTPVQNYSSGMAVRLGFAVAATLNPDILLLDEVLAVGDMHFQSKCLNRLGEMRRAGTSFILVSHNMVNIRRHCENVLYMDHGSIGFYGETNEGVTQYEKDILTTERTEGMPLTESGEKVAGTGRITMKTIAFTDLNGQVRSIFATGSPMLIKIDYMKHCDEDIDVMLELKVVDAEGILYQYRDEEVYRVCGGCGRCGTAILRIDNLPFNSPGLWISLVLWSRNYIEQYDWRKAIHLSIAPWKNSSGRIHFQVKTDWR